MPTNDRELGEIAKNRYWAEQKNLTDDQAWEVAAHEVLVRAKYYDLLEALKAAREALGTCSYDDIDFDFDKVRKAIAKIDALGGKDG